MKTSKSSVADHQGVEKNKVFARVHRKVTTPLRYPGGKSRALKKILPRIPLEFSEYREPFLGGGTIFIAVKQRRPDLTYWVNDLNRDLYLFWTNVRDNVRDLIREVKRLRSTHTDGRKLYEELNGSDFKKDEFSRAVRFTLLNRMTFSGTVDSGGYSSQAFNRGIPPAYISNLLRLSDLLKGVRITNQSYEKSLSEKGENVFIFLDPPYWDPRPDWAKLYGKHGNLHKSFNHSGFADIVKICKHRWLLTYCDSRKIRDLFRFADENTSQWELMYGMRNVNGRKVSKGKELFISNYSATQQSDRKQT